MKISIGIVLESASALVPYLYPKYSHPRLYLRCLDETDGGGGG